MSIFFLFSGGRCCASERVRLLFFLSSRHQLIDAVCFRSRLRVASFQGTLAPLQKLTMLNVTGARHPRRFRCHSCHNTFTHRLCGRAVLREPCSECKQSQLFRGTRFNFFSVYMLTLLAHRDACVASLTAARRCW